MFKSFALIAALGLACLVIVSEACSYPPCCVDRRKLMAIEEKLLFSHPGQFDEDVRMAHHDRRLEQEGCICPDIGYVEDADYCCCPDERGTKSSKYSKYSKSCKSGKASKGRGHNPQCVRHLSGDFIECNPVAEGRKDETPWASPASDMAELLAADPGIWAVPGFLNDELVNKFKALVDKYGKDLGHYSDCAPGAPEGKKCFKLTTDLAVKNEEDHKVHLEVKAKVQSLWPQFDLRPYLHINENPKGEVGPADYHRDGTLVQHMPCTVLIYLSDSDGTGGNTVFPYAGDDGLTVAPRKGMALTWLNIHADGEVKEKSLHGVQATTPNSNGRLIATQKFFLSPEKFKKVVGEEGIIV